MNINSIIKNLISVPMLVRFSLLFVLILFVSFLFPDNLNFEYDFEQGKRWQHEDLVAPFDFPIQKSPADMSEERKLIEKQLPSYYRWDKEMIIFQKQKFLTDFKYRLPVYRLSHQDVLLDSVSCLNLGNSLLSHIYEKRLIHFPLTTQSEKTDFSFELLDGNIDLGEYSTSDVFTPETAMQFVVDSLSSYDKKLPGSELLLELLHDIIESPNIVFDSLVTANSRNEAFRNISPNLGMVMAGDPIITRDRLVDSTTYSKLLSYKTKYNIEINQNKNSFLIYIGYLILTIALISIFAFYMSFFCPEVFTNSRHLSLIVIMIAGYSYLAYFVNDIYILDLYVIPFCIIPIIILNFFTAELALFTHIVIILLVSMLLSLDYQFILIQVLIGMVAVVSKLKTRYLSNFFISLLYIGIAYTFGFFSLELVRTGSLFPVVSANGNLISEGLRWYMLGWIWFNIFLTLLSYPMIPLLGKIFGLTSDITLMELSDLDNALLKRLSLVANGTLQHSMQVANLSEAAAKEIGANALLVKVAALYHDIGKIANPEYYIENQNLENPHEKLNCLESAQMIISHVTEGVKMAKKHRLPPVLIDFILTHHGTTRVEFFYRKYQKENPDIEVNPLDFTYPGPLPSTKEQAIMMIADSLEASSKSLKSPSEEDINNLVENIIQGKITMGQLKETSLSFQELGQIKMVFKRLLKSINHIRIGYPDEDKAKGQT